MRFFKQVALANVSLLSLASPAFAQDGAADINATGPDIIVQARRRDESIQDVPLVVNAVTSDQIQKLNIRAFTEVQNLVPGLLLSEAANGVGGNGQIRGVQYDINAGSNPSLAFYQNDALIDAGVVLQAMYDVADIQVLRGPQGTLRGQASPSGSIVISTRKPDLNEMGGNLNATGNTIGGINFNGGFGLPIIPGVAAIRVAGITDSSEGNRVRTIATTGDRRDPSNRMTSGRVSLRVEPTDWLRLEGVYQRLDRTSRGYDQYASYSLFDPSGAPSNPVIRPSNRRSINETQRSFKQKLNVYNWRAEVRQAGQALIYQGQTQDSKFRTVTNQDFANFLPGRDTVQNSATDTKITTHEVRLQSETRIADIFDYVLGFYSYRGATDVNVLNETPILLPLAVTGGRPTLVSVVTTPIRVIQAVLSRSVRSSAV